MTKQLHELVEWAGNVSRVLVPTTNETTLDAGVYATEQRYTAFCGCEYRTGFKSLDKAKDWVVLQITKARMEES